MFFRLLFCPPRFNSSPADTSIITNHRERMENNKSNVPTGQTTGQARTEQEHWLLRQHRRQWLVDGGWAAWAGTVQHYGTWLVATSSVAEQAMRIFHKSTDRTEFCFMKSFPAVVTIATKIIIIIISPKRSLTYHPQRSATTLRQPSREET